VVSGEPERVQLGGGASAAAARSRPSEAYDPETVEICLWETVLCGGNVAKAMQNLRAEYEDDPDKDAAELPYPETVRGWKRGKHRNRYHEIATGRARELEDALANRHIERAIRLDDLESEAIARVQGGIADVGAVDAANILRNVAAAKKLSVDSATALRRAANGQTGDERSIEVIVGALERLGVGRRVDADATAEEITDVHELGEGESPPSPEAHAT
jgi:hypothetical protein